MFIYLARHAWAGHFGDPQWPDDSLRELTPEGADRYARVIQTLAQRGFAPKRIAASPYARCLQTAELIARYTNGAPTIEECDALQPGSNFDELLAWTASHKGQDVCWVGHNPDMQHLAAALVGDGTANIRFAKGAVAAIRFDDHFAGAQFQSSGVLYWIATAKTLGL